MPRAINILEFFLYISLLSITQNQTVKKRPGNSTAPLMLVNILLPCSLLQKCANILIMQVD